MEKIQKEGSGGSGSSSVDGNVVSKGVRSAAAKWGIGKIAAVIMAAVVLLGAGAAVSLLAKGNPDDEEVAAEVKVTANPETDEKPNAAEAKETTEATSTTEPAPKSEKETYYEYLNQELVPKYGLVKLNQEGTLSYFSGVDNPLLDERNQWLKPIGILSAYIKDLDQDGKKELFVLYWKEHKDEDFAHELTAEVYEQEEGKVALADSVAVSGLGYGWNEWRDIAGLFLAADMAVGKKHYLLFAQYDTTVFFSDGAAQGMRSMEYRDGKLQTVQEVLQTGAEGDDFAYKGYTYKDGKKEEEVVYGYSTKEGAAYDTVEEAYIGYFKREKLDVSEIANGYQFNYNEIGEETSFINNLNKTKGATLLCTVNTWSRNSSGNSSGNQKHFFFKGKDKTKLRKHITKK